MANNLARFQRWSKNLVEAVIGRKRTEITIETDRLLIIRRRRTVRFWCRQCRREVDMIDLREAEALTGTPQAVLSCGRGDRGWHWSQAEDGSPLLCLESVRRSLQSSPPNSST